MEFTTVFTTFNPAEADLVASQLEAAGFDATVMNALANLTLGAPATSGSIRVEVPQAQAVEARALLDATITSNNPPPADADAASDS